MARTLNLRRTMGLAAALAFTGLSSPLFAEDPPRYFIPECAQYYKDVYCPAHWQAEHFASSTACADYYKEGCYYTYYVGLDLPTGERRG